MLVVTRKVGQKIMVGKDGEIEIVILSIHGSEARVGVLAPKDTPIHREEVFERIQAGVPHPRDITRGDSSTIKVRS